MKKAFAFFLSLLLLPALACADLDVWFLDVGQGDATVVLCDGEAMVVDGGLPTASEFLYSFVRKTLQLEHVDYLVATHPHDDHIGGLPAVLNAAPVDLILSPVESWESDRFDALLSVAEAQGTPIVVPAAGDTLRLGRARITILHCWPEAWIVNDMGICLRVDYGQTSVLITGDAEYTAEYMMIDSGLNLQSDILCVGHHGSDSSPTQEFLRAVNPDYAIISCGRDNPYGQPRQIVLDMLRSQGAEVFRTDLQGTIHAVSDGRSFAILPERETDQDVYTGSSLRGRDDDLEPLPEDSDGIVRGMPAEEEPENGEELESPEETVPPEDSDEQPEEQEEKQVTYVLNRKTKKFHYPSCSSVTDMKPANRMDFEGTRDELLALGYDPCGRCHP